MDCLTANEAGLNGAADSEVLTYAALYRRAVVTHDREDFQRLHGQWMRADRDHSGIVVVTSSRMALPAIAGSILRLQIERDSERMRNAILFIGPSTAG